MRHNYQVDSDNVAKFKEWQSTRGGVVIWTNKEIGTSRPHEVCTPKLQIDGTPTPCPDWRYIGDPEEVDFTSLQVNTFDVKQSFNGRTKRYYWGYGLLEATERKAEKLAKAIGGEYRYTFDYPAIAKIDIGLVKVVPFSEYIAQ